MRTIILIAMLCFGTVTAQEVGDKIPKGMFNQEIVDEVTSSGLTRTGENEFVYFSGGDTFIKYKWEDGVIVYSTQTYKNHTYDTFDETLDHYLLAGFSYVYGDKDKEYVMKLVNGSIITTVKIYDNAYYETYIEQLIK